MPSNKVRKAALGVVFGDPEFQVLAKALYGPDANFEMVAEDLGLIEKAGPDPADVHVPGNSKKKPKVMTLTNSDNPQLEENVGKADGFSQKHPGAKKAALLGGLALGTGAEALAAGRSLGKVAEAAGPSGLKAGERMGPHVGRVKLPGTSKTIRAPKPGLAGEAGIQTANFGVGVTAMHEIKGNKPKTVKAARDTSALTELVKGMTPAQREIVRKLFDEQKHRRDSDGKFGGSHGTTFLGRRQQKINTLREVNRRAKADPQYKKERHKELAGGYGAAAGYLGGNFVASRGIRNLSAASSKAEAADIGMKRSRDEMREAAAQHQLHGNKVLGEGEHPFFAAHGRYEEALGRSAAAGDQAARGVRQLHGGLGVAGAGVLAGMAYNIHHAGKRSKRGRQFERSVYEERGLKVPHRSRNAAPLEKRDTTWAGEVSKVDEDKRQVFGWASVVEVDGQPVIDKQGDYLAPDDMENAAYDFVLKSRIGGDQHRRIEKADGGPHHVSDMIESFVLTPEKADAMGIGPVNKTAWWVGFKVHDDEAWDMVKKGERTGFSIHGMGRRVEKSMDEIDPVVKSLIDHAREISKSEMEFGANLAMIMEVAKKRGEHGLQVPQSLQHPDAALAAGAGAGLAAAGMGALAIKRPESMHTMGNIVGSSVGGSALGMTAANMAQNVSNKKNKRPQRPASLSAQQGMSAGMGMAGAR